MAKSDPPAPPRQRLADAIDALRQEMAQRQAVVDAYDRLCLMVEVTESRLQDAKAAADSSTKDVASRMRMGDFGMVLEAPADIAEALRTFRDLEIEAEAARRARDELAPDVRRVSGTPFLLERKRDEAIAAVILADGKVAADQTLDRIEGLQRDLAQLAVRFKTLAGAGLYGKSEQIGPNYGAPTNERARAVQSRLWTAPQGWDLVRSADDPGSAHWRAAIEALKTDPMALLPLPG